MQKTIFYLVLFNLIFISCKKGDEPYACFTPPLEIVYGISYTFEPACSEYGDEYFWDFGDGNTSNLQSPSHSFLSVGDYSVTLTVKNEFGEDKHSEIISVYIPAFTRHLTDITNDETWGGETVHYIAKDVEIKGATLTIEPGATIKFENGRGLYIGYYDEENSKIIAEGTADKPIKFTTVNDTLNPSAGDWDFIGIGSGAATGSSFKYCTFEYGGGYSDISGIISLKSASITMENCTICNSGSYGILLDNTSSFATFSNNTIKSCALNPIFIYPNYVHAISSNNIFETKTGVLIKGGKLDIATATWSKLNLPYNLSGELFIGSSEGTTLTLAPGTTISLSDGSGIFVGYQLGETASLIAEGTADMPITFTSSKTTKSLGDWDYIGFYFGSNNSKLNYTKIEYGGGYNADKGSIYIDNCQVSIDNSTIENSLFNGITLNKDGFFTSFSNNTIGLCGLYPIKIYADKVSSLGTSNSISTSLPIEIISNHLTAANVTWNKQTVPYHVNGDINIGSPNGSTLNIAAGTTIKFAKNAGLHVGLQAGQPGSIIAIGTSSEPITFTSASNAGSEAAGDWDGLFFYQSASNKNTLENCIVSYAGLNLTASGNINCSNMPNGNLGIYDCTISNSMGYGIYSNTSNIPQTSGNTFLNNAGGDTNF